MFDSLRSRLLILLVSFSFCILAVTLFAFIQFSKSRDSLSRVSEKTQDLKLMVLSDIMVMHDFFESDCINPQFFITHNSKAVAEHQRFSEQIARQLIDLYDLQYENDFRLTQHISALKVRFNLYLEHCEVIKSFIIKRGYKDYGVEGEMRSHAHILEQYSEEIGLINILQLRRHEKDFIIRQEDKYVRLHNELSGFLLDKIRNSRLSSERAALVVGELQKYSALFNRMVDLEKKLGLKTGSGLKRATDEQASMLVAKVSQIAALAAEREMILLSKIKWVYVLSGIVFIVLSILFAFIVSRRISRSISHLNSEIDEFVKSDFTTRALLPVQNSKSEIDVLTSNFSIMEQQIVDSMANLRQTKKDLEMLFYATSNDVRMPLLEVKDITGQALKNVKDETAIAYLIRIDNSWSELLTIIDELGIITNVRNVEPEFEEIDAEELIRSIFQEFKMHPRFDNIVFSLQLRLEYKFRTSRSLLKIIFRNLLENGVRYATKRSSFSFLKVSLLSEGVDMVRIVVEDNGIGIKKEYQDKIFDMFFRGTNYTSGTGLGLYIVQNCLDKLHGTISVSSDENKGTTFTIIVPNNRTRAKQVFSSKDVFSSVI
jgi:signal transduction histidine kinase